MGAHGGASPGPWSHYQARTLFLRVPTPDWAAVKTGHKTQIRWAGGKEMTQFGEIPFPTPVVAYAIFPGPRHLSQLMRLEKTWDEPLIAINEASLAAEGHESVASFRRYWMSRTKKRFEPMTPVRVYQLGPLLPGELDDLGATLIRRLYRDHL